MANFLQSNNYQKGFQPFSVPKINLGDVVPTARPKAGTPFSSQVNDLINQLGGFLKPEQPLTERLPFGQFAAPERQTFQQFGEQFLRPEFERFKLRPFEQQAASQGAVYGPSGRRAQQFGQQSTLLEKGFMDELEAARSVFEQAARENYQRQLTSLGLSPTQFTNIGL